MLSSSWISAWCSVLGSSHILENLPCQDNTKVEYLIDTDFVIAAVSDGAGSCENSQIGSKFLVDNSIIKLSEYIKLKIFGTNELELKNEDWRKDAFGIFQELKNDLKEKAVELDIDFKSLSATLIVAFSNGKSIYCANVGDGRAGFRDKQGEWLPMLIPTKGEEANQTLFVTSEMWDNDSSSEYFGTFVLEDQITAFTLLSDGCERASFEILKFNESEDKYYDPNLPFKPFFEPNYQNLIKLNTAGYSQEQINGLWEKFIQSGNQKLINETDDKSMILSVYLNSQIDESQNNSH
jgi:hypothetical protein